MKIVIDLDGVLARFLDGMYVLVNDLWPGRIGPDYVPHDWEHSDVLSPEETSQVFGVIEESPNFWMTLEPYEDAVKALRRFLYFNPRVEVYFLTARAPAAGVSLLEQCIRWLDELGLWLPNTSVTVVASGKSKGKVIKAIGADFSIDDSADTVDHTMRDAHEGHRAYLLSRSWNEHDRPKFARPGADFARVNSVEEFLGIIEDAMKAQDGQTAN